MKKFMDSKEIVGQLRKHLNPKYREGMVRFGINPEYALGVRIPVLRSLAKKIGKNHKLAQELWRTKIHEARILACMIDEPKRVTEQQMESWVKKFNSWDLCDQCCMNLFNKLSFAWEKAIEWAERKEEFIKRAGFVLMACLARHDKKAKDRDFVKFFPVIKKQARDDRNFVKKAVNWALRQIGKRSSNLNKKAVQAAKEIQRIDSKTARWIATDAIRELTSEKIRKTLPR